MKKSFCISYYIGLTLVLASCSSEYYTTEDFNNVKKMDTHVHLSSENTALAEQAKEDNFQLVSLNVDLVDKMLLEKQKAIAIAQHKQYPGQVDFTSAFTLKNFETPN